MSGRSPDASGTPDTPPEGYLGAEGRIRTGPAPELVRAGYEAEIADAPLLHRGLNLADLAHLIELVEIDVVPAEAAARLARVLLDLLDTDPGEFPYDPLYGDAYNSRERELEARLGTDAGWLHTGRTRREAGRIAFRLALRTQLVGLHRAIGRFAAALLERADEHAGTLWNDTTYLQPAQPSTFGHYLLSFAEEAVRHLDRVEAAHAWADTSPAGVGGVNGSRVPLDRRRLADLLGFSTLGAHTRDAMWATDGVVDAIVVGAQGATTVDRLAEDLEIFASPQFGYVTLDASLCRASVQMPQKRNPYALVVLRGGANTLLGRVSGALATQRTPSARTDNWLFLYGEAAGALEQTERLVDLGAAVVETLQIDLTALTASAGANFSCATDLTEALVLSGDLDYRSAYRLVGRAVAGAIEEGRGALRTEAVLGLVGDRVDPATVSDALNPASVVATRTAPGGAAPERVTRRSAALRERLRDAEDWRIERRARHSAAEESLTERARALVDGGA